MKKAKILLTAIGVFAIIGGALAFKANGGRGELFCSTTAALPPLCTTVVDFTITVIPQPLKGYCTTNPNLPCTRLTNLTFGGC